MSYLERLNAIFTLWHPTRKKAAASTALTFIYDNRVKMTHSEFDQCIKRYVDYLRLSSGLRGTSRQLQL